MVRKQQKIALLTSLTKKNEAREYVLENQRRNQIIQVMEGIERTKYRNFSSSTPIQNNRESLSPNMSSISYFNNTLKNENTNKPEEPLVEEKTDVVKSKIKILQNITLIRGSSPLTSSPNISSTSFSNISHDENNNKPEDRPINGRRFKSSRKEKKNILLTVPKENRNVPSRNENLNVASSPPSDLSNNNISYTLRKRPFKTRKNDIKKYNEVLKESNLFKTSAVPTRITRSMTKRLHEITNDGNNFISTPLQAMTSTSSNTIPNYVSVENSICDTSETKSLGKWDTHGVLKKGTSSINSKILTDNVSKKKVEIVPSDQNNNQLVKSSNTRTNKGADMQMDVLSDRANLTHTNTTHTKEEAILTKCSEDKIRQKVNNANHATPTSSTINVEKSTLRRSVRERKLANLLTISYVHYIDKDIFQNMIEKLRKNNESVKENTAIILPLHVLLKNSSKRKRRTKRSVKTKKKSTNVLNVDGDNLKTTCQTSPPVLKDEENVKDDEILLNNVNELCANGDVTVDKILNEDTNTSGCNSLESASNDLINFNSELCVCKIYHTNNNTKHCWLTIKPNGEIFVRSNPHNEVCLTVYQGNGKMTVNKRLLQLKLDMSYVIMKGEKYSIVNNNRKKILKIHLIVIH